ncbi:MAG TPA: Asp-tRNA(Asn)/Glu-tRNA(Gln) amidotransferase subunit GatC [Chlamydiales bacterium]|nr:Asp-tRNA(Asn)/Glu-tRNA(Gln) amidotransferase subunit GatC [Chlamydiales bacterium]
MKNFNPNTLKELEKLCRIECSEEEEKEFLDKLAQIVHFIEMLDEIDTTNVQNPPHLLAEFQQTKYRKDIPNANLPTEKFLQNAPDKIGDMIKIPPVIQGSEDA